MTDLNVSSVPIPQHEGSSRWKRTALAGFLSLLIAGMGQLYNRQPRKAVWLAVMIPILLVLAAQTRIVFSFVTMVGFLALLTSWRLLSQAKQPMLPGKLRCRKPHSCVRVLPILWLLWCSLLLHFSRHLTTLNAGLPSPLSKFHPRRCVPRFVSVNESLRT